MPVFDDRNTFWYSQTKLSGVDVPKTGTQIQVVSVSAQGNFMQIQVSPAK